MNKFRLRNKKKAAADSNSEMVDGDALEVVPPVTVHARRNKRHAQLDLTNQHGEAINLSFPSNVAAHSEFHKCCNEAEKLLFHNDRDLLEHMGNESVATAAVGDAFMQLQKAIFLREKICQMAQELNEAKSEKAIWQTEMDAIAKAYEDAGEVIKRLEAARAEDARRAAADCKAFEKRIKQLEEQVEYVSCDTEIITRGLMTAEFIKIKPPQTWDVSRYLAEFEEWKMENPDWVAQFEKQQESQGRELVADFAGMSTGVLQPVNQSAEV